jgi:hypothetical protein
MSIIAKAPSIPSTANETSLPARGLQALAGEEGSLGVSSLDESVIDLREEGLKKFFVQL